jgi:hypothetical protein
MPHFMQRNHLESQDGRCDIASVVQFDQSLIRSLKQLWMWITVIGQILQKLRHVVTRVKMRQVASRCAKTPFELCFSKQVESVGGFVEEHYATDGKQVKSSLERALGPTSAFSQRRDLAKVFCEQRRDHTRFRKLDETQDDRERLFR